MSLRTLPEAKVFPRPKNYQPEAPSDVMADWSAKPLAAEADDASTISIYDVIGDDFWSGGGFTAKRASAALRSIGANPVTVNINSPGGDMFEGIAIYNAFRAHPAKVTVNVMGIAASAASIIAMAGDEVNMGLGTFMMVHNAWGLVVGNQHDLAEASELFGQFDSALADIYEARTGQSRASIEKLMDAESFLSPADAVEKGFADSVDKELKAAVSNQAHPGSVNAKRRIESLLAKQDVPRSERRRLLNELTGGTHDAAPTVTQDAGLDLAAVRQLIETIKTH